MILLRVADHTDAPGAEFIRMGPHSGEWFWNTVLEPCIKKAIETTDSIVIDLDGVIGYPFSWLRGAFSPIGKIKDKEEWCSVALRIDFKTDTFEDVVDDIRYYMCEMNYQS